MRVVSVMVLVLGRLGMAELRLDGGGGRRGGEQWRGGGGHRVDGAPAAHSVVMLDAEWKIGRLPSECRQGLVLGRRLLLPDRAPVQVGPLWRRFNKKKFQVSMA